MFEMYPIILLIAAVLFIAFALRAKFTYKDNSSFRRNTIVGYMVLLTYFSLQIEGMVSLTLVGILFIGFFVMCYIFAYKERKNKDNKQS